MADHVDPAARLAERWASKDADRQRIVERLADEAPPLPRCDTHARNLVDCQWRFRWRLMTALDRARCSDINGPDWEPPLIPAMPAKETL